jgi:hypothetical protein
MTRSLYLRDPLFLACVLAYFVNRWAMKPLMGGGFLHDHLNDLVCIPFWVPIMLWGQRRLGYRRSDGAPLAGEILIPLFVWSWFFEFVVPRAGSSDSAPSRTTGTSCTTRSGPHSRPASGGGGIRTR